MIEVSACARAAILYTERALLLARRREVERLLASDEAAECLVGAAALSRLLLDEQRIDRAIGCVWLADRIQYLALAARFAARPGLSLENDLHQVRRD